MRHFDVIIVGGGAAGFFTAINLAQFNPDLSVLLIEKGNQFLGKVKVSGGGRCNVTHACFEPKELVKFYPRGSKELLGPFHSFQPGDTFEWFASRGVEIKIEDDNRCFPITDSSQTIIDCFLTEARKSGVQLELQTGISAFSQTDSGWRLETNRGEFSCSRMMLATGSTNQIWQQCEKLGLKLVKPVPSLFTFNCKHPVFENMQGTAVNATVTISKDLSETGPVLFTHWGLSGPGVLRLSAWGAEYLAQKDYHFKITLAFVPFDTEQEVLEELKQLRMAEPKKKAGTYGQFGLPNKLWTNLINYHQLETKSWADLSNQDLQALAKSLTGLEVQVNGKSTFKEEFVTCGGIDLKEVDFKTMEAKNFPGLYFAGETLNIDAITGGFNFQAAWTTGYLAAKAMAESIS